MVCEKCKLTDHPEKCMHKIAERPAWKDKDKFSTVKQIYGDRITYLQRESMYASFLANLHRGHVAGADNAVFSSKWVAELKKHDLFSEIPVPPPDQVIISCDPNGGGTSHMAIVSAFYYRRVMVVCTRVGECVCVCVSNGNVFLDAFFHKSPRVDNASDDLLLREGRERAIAKFYITRVELLVLFDTMC